MTESSLCQAVELGFRVIGRIHHLTSSISAFHFHYIIHSNVLLDQMELVGLKSLKIQPKLNMLEGRKEEQDVTFSQDLHLSCSFTHCIILKYLYVQSLCSLPKRQRWKHDYMVWGKTHKIDHSNILRQL